MLITEMDLPEFDFLDPTLSGERYHETVRELAASGWLAKSPIAYFVFDREAGEQLLRTRSARFPGLEIAQIFGIEDGPLAEEMRRNILHLDDGDHRRLRQLVNPFFTPRAANRWRPNMQAFLEQLWAPLDGIGACEAVEDLCKPYPSLTIATVMGAPLADAPKLHEWSNWIQKQFDAPTLTTQRERIDRAVAEFYEWVGPMIDARRQTPGDDLISSLIQAEEEGDRLSDVECRNLVLNVLVGGVDTTQSQLAHALILFARHPEQWALLAREPERAPAAVMEVVRHEPITPFTARIMREDLEIRDVTFPTGTIVMVAAVTANRDGIADGERFDITRSDAERVLTFGAGPHYCLGVNLARAELEEALTFLAPRMPGLRLAGHPELEGVHGIYGVARLALEWD
ncbi:MAG: cytochrome [Solirubrobacteraceae bacterium]|nr:cytochrome [Solirubrobacteraceae bacterium]